MDDGFVKKTILEKYMHHKQWLLFIGNKKRNFIFLKKIEITVQTNINYNLIDYNRENDWNEEHTKY